MVVAEDLFLREEPRYIQLVEDHRRLQVDLILEPEMPALVQSRKSAN